MQSVLISSLVSCNYSPSLIMILLIKGISVTPIYYTTWERRTLCANTNNPPPFLSKNTHTHTHTHMWGGGGGGGRHGCENITAMVDLAFNTNYLSVP